MWHRGNLSIRIGGQNTKHRRPTSKKSNRKGHDETSAKIQNSSFRVGWMEPWFTLRHTFERGDSGAGVDALSRTERPRDKPGPSDADQVDTRRLQLEGETAGWGTWFAGDLEGQGLREFLRSAKARVERPDRPPSPAAQLPLPSSPPNISAREVRPLSLSVNLQHRPASENCRVPQEQSGDCHSRLSPRTGRTAQVR